MGEIKERVCAFDTGARYDLLICVSSRDHHEHIHASDVLAAPADQVVPVAPA
jgi:hypothetical protein